MNITTNEVCKIIKNAFRKCMGLQFSILILLVAEC
jgi:hypothetical protein